MHLSFKSRYCAQWLVALLTVVLASLTAMAQPAGSGGVNRPEQLGKPYVVLVSLDGFKPEYIDTFDMPHMRQIAARGVRARKMQPVFPSLTFPNHYSLVTGLHPGRHGIVSNRFYDPARKDTYVYTDNDKVTDGTWYGGEPIWVTAEVQGMVAACYFWPGSEAAIKGVRPTIYNRYSAEIPNEQRVKTVLDWLQLPADRRPHLITLYFSDLDSASHSGPADHESIEETARAIDNTLGQLIAGIDMLPVHDKVYLILTSDHGMIDTTPKQSVQLASLLEPGDLKDIAQAFSGAVANIHVRGGAARARELRDKIAGKLAHGKAYLRDELPERYHYSMNPRSGDIVVVMDEAWTMSVPRSEAAETPRAVSEAPAAPRPARPQRERWGMHGWDPELPSMQALFIAIGPGIRPNTVVDEVKNVDVYPLMAELLGLTAAPDIDGRAGEIRKMIMQQPVPVGASR